MKIDVGTVGITRDHTRMTITQALDAGDPGYDQGYRFMAESDLAGGISYRTRAYILYDEKGRHQPIGAHSTATSPADIIRIVNASATVIHFRDVRLNDVVGEYVPGENVIVNGPLGGWVLSSVFSIRQNLYSAHLPASNVRLGRDNELLLSSMHVASIGSNPQPDDVIGAVLLVWKTGGDYYMGLAEMPSSVS